MPPRPPVLFIAPVPWDGLRQRHQALAAGLARRGFSVTYLDPIQGGGSRLTAEEVAAGRLVRLQMRVPFRASAWPGLQAITVRLAAGLLRRAGALTPHHLVWIADPSLAGLFGSSPRAATSGREAAPVPSQNPGLDPEAEPAGPRQRPTKRSSGQSPPSIHGVAGASMPPRSPPGVLRSGTHLGPSALPEVGADLDAALPAAGLSGRARQRTPSSAAPCPAGMLVYDRCDRHGAFPGQRAAVWERYERWLFGRAALVVATCPALLPTPEETTARCLLLPNAASPRRKSRAGDCPRPAPPPWRLLSAGAHFEWTDLAWLERLTRLPQVEVHLAGPGRGPAFARLRQLPTVIDHGTLAADALDELLSTCHVGLIPFRDLPLTRAVDPIKAYEYKLYDLYVWATGPATLRDHPCVDLVTDPAADPTTDWTTALAQIIRSARPPTTAQPLVTTGQEPPATSSRRFRVPTWEDRLDRLVQELEVMGW